MQAQHVSRDRPRERDDDTNRFSAIQYPTAKPEVEFRNPQEPLMFLLERHYRWFAQFGWRAA